MKNAKFIIVFLGLMGITAFASSEGTFSGECRFKMGGGGVGSIGAFELKVDDQHTSARKNMPFKFPHAKEQYTAVASIHLLESNPPRHAIILGYHWLNEGELGYVERQALEEDVKPGRKLMYKEIIRTSAHHTEFVCSGTFN